MQTGNSNGVKRYAEKAFLIFLVLAALLSIAAIITKEWKTKKQNDHQQEPPRFRRLLDGVWVPRAEDVVPPFAGVMIENMVEAQPLSGLAEANVVFEAIAEANITRFFALYTLEEGREIPAIGPVRSARPYYLDWASEFDTLFAHVGSSPEAYGLLRRIGLPRVHDLDQWYASTYFFENNGRRRPHHLYTSSVLLKEAFAKEKASPKFQPWLFKDDANKEERGSVSSVTIGYQSPYDVTWRYNADVDHYTRFQWGGVHTDALGREIVAKNVVVVFQEMEIQDEIGRKRFTTIGQGEAIIFQDGKVLRGVWKKPDRSERMRFFDETGNEVTLNAGVTWVEIVPKEYSVNWTQH